jgi:hypothetical protein
MSGSPLKKELFKNKFGKNIFSFFDYEFKNFIYSIVVEGSNLKKRDEFEKVLNQKLNEFIENGFDKDLLISAINKIEFELKEKEVGHSTLSIDIFIDVLSTWLYDDSKIFDRLIYNQTFEEVKKEILENNYLENLIKEYLIQNKHSVFLTLLPNSDIDPNMIEKNTLKEIERNLSKEEIEEIKVKQKKVELFSSKKDSKEDIDKIKLIDLEEIDKDVFLEDINKDIISLNNSKVNVFEIKNLENEIVYNELFFNAKVESKEDLQYLELMSEVLDEMRTKDLDFEDFSNEYNKYLGDISFNLDIFSDNKSSIVDKDIKIKLKVQFKYLIQNMNYVSNILNDFLFNIVFDKEKVREIIIRIKNNMKNSFISNGHIFSIYDIDSKVSKVGALNNLIKGFEFYDFISKLEKDFDKNSDLILLNLENVYKKIFYYNLKEFDFWAFSKDKFDFKNFLSGLDLKVFDDLGFDEKKYFNFIENFNLNESKNTLYVIPSQINYVALGNNFKNFGFDYCGSMDVLKNSLYADYLWENVRLKGGAYGAIHNINNSGLLYFVSYRDPNFEKTLEVYRKIPSHIKNLNFDEKEIKVLIIGAISRFDKPVDVEDKLSYLCGLYYSNIDKDYLKKIKLEILKSNLDNLKELAPVFEKVIMNGKITVYGFEQLKDKKEFDKIIDIN